MTLDLQDTAARFITDPAGHDAVARSTEQIDAVIRDLSIAILDLRDGVAEPARSTPA